MDRAHLQALLAAGPSLRLDVLAISARLVAAGRDDELLFEMPFLNRSVLLKHVDAREGGRCAGTLRPIHMLIYLPYDPDCPGEGGETLLYSRQALAQLATARIGVIDEASTALRHDAAVLERLDALPSLNPFLLRGVAEPAIPQSYLELESEAVARLQQRLERRIRPLIVAALGRPEEEVGADLDRMVEGFLSAAERHHLRSFAGALQLEPAEAETVLEAWTGIAFFEDEIVRLKPRVQTFAEQLIAASKPLKWLPATEHGRLAERLAAVRAAMRDAWLELRSILECYQRSYDALVFDAAPEAFVAFLRDSPAHYWRLGELCAYYEQAVRTWTDGTVADAEGRVPLEALDDVVGFLEQVFPGAGGTPPTAKAAGALH